MNYLIFWKVATIVAWGILVIILLSWIIRKYLSVLTRRWLERAFDAQFVENVSEYLDERVEERVQAYVAAGVEGTVTEPGGAKLTTARK